MTATDAMARRAVFGFAAMVLCLVLAACGGGGGGNAVSASNGTNATVLTAVGFPPSQATLKDANVAAISVEAGPGTNVNIPFVTVTVCVPGSSNCSTIDHVLLDTGSTGLRLFADKVGVALPAQTIGASADISECAQFLNSVAWGKIKLADVQIGGEKTTTAVPVQLMDAGFAPVPVSACGSAPLLSDSSSTSSNTRALGANGILGVGLFSYDSQTYFNCASPSRSCLIRPLHNQQVQNPVSLFASNNNGVVVQLPALGAGGASSALGYLIFGVETSSNNGLNGANVVAMNGSGVYFTSSYKGVAYDASYFDTGSNGLYFDDLAIASCGSTLSDFYCPAGALSLTASLPLANAQAATVSFSIANTQALFTDPATAGNHALNNLGGHFYTASSRVASNNFDWGLPFFFGRSVYTVIEGATVGSGASALTGPFNAFSN